MCRFIRASDVGLPQAMQQSNVYRPGAWQINYQKALEAPVLTAK